MMVVTTCKNNSDLKGDKVLAGTLYFINIADGISDTDLVANAKIFIQYASVGTSSYLYSTNTGPDGKFLFSNLSGKKQYIIFTIADTLGASFTLVDSPSIGTENLNIYFTPQNYATNGFSIHVVDTLSSPVANFGLFVFNSATLASDNDSAGSIFELKTDIYGNAYRYNLQPGTYYVNAGGIVGNTMLEKKISFPVTATGVANETMILDSAQNGFNLLITDSLNTPVANCRLFVFNSAMLAASNDSIGNIFQLQSDIYGRAAKYDLNPGVYYVNVHDSVGNIVLGMKDSVTVQINGITDSTIRLMRLP